MISRKGLIALAAGGSAALLLAALGFQYLGGLAPCKLCYWQRWPHLAAVLIGAVGLAVPAAAIAWAGAAAALTTAAIGVYHAGVEQHWWQGPDTCTSGSVDGLSSAELMERILNAPLVRCDEIPWEFLGLSMASWNAIASFALALIWVAAARRPG